MNQKATDFPGPPEAIAPGLPGALAPGPPFTRTRAGRAGRAGSPWMNGLRFRVPPQGRNLKKLVPRLRAETPHFGVQARALARGAPQYISLEKMSKLKLDQRSRELRKMIVKTLAAGGRGHVGAAFSLVEILRVLYDDVLQYDPKNTTWSQRDRCILSKGHGCLALYVLLAEKGFFPESELWKFCKADGSLGGHPEHKIPGVEASTGSLGHGLSLGVGMALNARYEKANYRTFVVVGDGECNEGSIWEAALCAAKHKLDNLTVIIDYNKQQSYSTTSEVLDLEPFADKWRAFGFATKEVDGHNVEELKSTLLQIPFESNKPNAIICHTIKGKGISYVENNLNWHHKNKIADEEVKELLAELGAS